MPQPTSDDPVAARLIDALQSALDSSEQEAPGQRIGGYKLIQKIGVGGFGTVWMADQLEPVRRRVALKIVKAGMDTEEVIARFEAERQALALMDHPNIARVFEAGATAAGRPYFVMEFVRGVPITHHCDENRLTAEERLRLFIAVCQAVQHAHQMGVIHRDLKPSNVLVTLHDGPPVAKVIDFGIAKAIGRKLTEKTLVTQFHAFIGTPVYSSPEQMEMSALDVDTRSDVYSLGVLLYELLVGRPPFDPEALMKAGLDAMRTMIREVDPPRPSSRLRTLIDQDRTSIAGQRSTDAAKLSLLLRGDLDWIAMRCLEKDRARRYDTANALARDVQRHLAHEPVNARPRSTLYRTQKFARRHRFGVAAAAAITVLLVVALILSSTLFVRERAARQRAVAAEKSEGQLRHQAEAVRQAAEESRARAEAQAYATDMNLVQQSLERDNFGRALDLLNRYRPRPAVSPDSSADLRGWEWRYLWQLSRGDASLTLCEGRAHIKSVAVSHDGGWVAHGAFSTGELSVWNLATRRELRLAAGNGEVLVAFSPSELLLAYACAFQDDTGAPRRCVRLWHGASQTIVAEIPLGAPCIGLAFSGDGKSLATLAEGTELALWRASDGTNLARHPTPDAVGNQNHPFSISRDFSRVAYVVRGPTENTGTACVLELATGDQRRWETIGGSTRAVALSPDGQTLAYASFYFIHLSDTKTGAKLAQLTGHSNHLNQLAFSRDGRFLASAGVDQMICVWDVSTPTRATLVRTLRRHQSGVRSVAFLPDNPLVSGGREGAVYQWDFRGLPLIRTGVQIRGTFTDWSFAPDSRSVLTVDRQGIVTRWHGSGLQESKRLLELGAGPRQTRFSRTGGLLAIGSSNGTVHVHDLEDASRSRQFVVPWKNVSPQEFLAAETRIVLRDDGGGHLHEWDLRAEREIQSWRGRGTIAFSHDGGHCLMVLPDRTPSVLRELSSRREIELSLDIDARVTAAAFSPSGRFFAASTRRGYAVLGETAQPQRPAVRLNPYIAGCTTVAFSPDSRRLAIGALNAFDGLKIWNPEIGQELFVITEAPNEAKATPDRRGPGGQIDSADERFAREPADNALTPEQVFDRAWAVELIEGTLAELRAEYERSGRGALFAALAPLVWGHRAMEGLGVPAAQLGMSTHAFTVALQRLRRRLGERLRSRVAETVADTAEIDVELRHLVSAIVAAQ